MDGDFFSETPQGDKQRHNEERQSDKSRVSQAHNKLPEGQMAQTGNKLTHKVKYADVAGEHKLKTDTSVVKQVNRLSVRGSGLFEVVCGSFLMHLAHSLAHKN